jgi:tRNA uridine 5-carboxymethylaminomethyl modification enzyme
MLTSRAEHRVVLRHDNADLRLTPLGREIGLIGDEPWDAFVRRRDALDAASRHAAGTRLGRERIGADAFGPGATVAEALRRPNVAIADVLDRFPPGTDPAIAERADIEIKMEGYVRRAEAAIERAARDEAVALPPALDYADVPALSREAREKLARVRPRTLGAATRIPGITPADVALVGVHVHRLLAGSPA